MKEISKDRKISDEDLGSVIGGVQEIRNTGAKGGSAASKTEAYCPKCQVRRMFTLGSGGRAYCEVCNKEIML